MARRRWVWDPKVNDLVEVSTEYQQAQAAPMVVPDLPGYQSPVTGLWVEGRKARREDLARTGCRAWEGKAQEVKEATRQREYVEQKRDVKLDAAVRTAFHQLSPQQRRALERG
jgi:hypothetical protein